MCPCEAQQPAIRAQGSASEVLSEDLALLTCRSAHFGESGELQRHTYRASHWQLTESGWRIRFHQSGWWQGFVQSFESLAGDA